MRHEFLSLSPGYVGVVRWGGVDAEQTRGDVEERDIRAGI